MDLSKPRRAVKHTQNLDILTVTIREVLLFTDALYMEKSYKALMLSIKYNVHIMPVNVHIMPVTGILSVISSVWGFSLDDL